MIAQAAAQSVRVDEQLELARWSSGGALLVGLGVAAGLLWAVAWLYRHEGRGDVRPWPRRLLVLFRCAVLLLLGLIGLEPVIVRYVHRRIDATTLVLIDESASMSLVDRYRSEAARQRVGSLPGVAELSRAQVARAVASDAWRARLAQRNRVQVAGFADRLRDAGPTSASVTAAAHADGPSTNLGQALRQAVERVGDAPLAGVIVLTDGNVNDGEPLDAIERYLVARHVHCSAVGIGDAAPPVNVRVAEVTAPRMVFKQDPFQVTATILAAGLDRRPIPVELVERTASGEQVVDRRTVQPRGDGQFEPVVFEQKRAAPGEVTYVVRVPPLEEETISADNERETLPAVRVIEDKLRVLVVAGAPTFDYRYLARLLTRDKTINSSCWLQSADENSVREGTTIIDHLPLRAAELFPYDAVVLIDPDPGALPDGWAKLLGTLVSEHGGGVLYAAGRKFSADFVRAPANAPLVDLLPVVRDNDAELVLNELGLYQRRGWPVLLAPDARDNPILRLADDPVESQALWNLFDGAFWHFPVRREKPAASILLRHSNPRMVNAAGPHILLATQIVGAGRSAFLGFDDTWRLRRVSEPAFGRFWTQAVRFLAEGKLLGTRSRASLFTDRDRYTFGDTILVTARVLDERYQPLSRDSLDVSLTADNRAPRTVSLSPIDGRPGFYRGRCIADQLGLARLALELPQSAGDPLRVQREIAVAPSNLEFANPVMRRAELVELAGATGGRYCDVAAAGELPDSIPDCSQTVVTRERPRPVWDNAAMLALLIALLGLEWAIRRAVNLL
ncbi:MAG: vWA domain-containing protein [Phycisphaerae bacterium]